VKDTLQKQAAQAIKQLQGELGDITDEFALYKTAHDLTLKLYKLGALSAEDINLVFEDYRHKTYDELTVIEKAAELNKEGLSFGTLSTGFQDDGTIDPLTRMLLED